MTTSTEPVSSEPIEAPFHTASPGDATEILGEEMSADLYAESELQLRHERTERMIRRAQEQV